MPAKRATAAVFIHGLARKPPPIELIKIWQRGLSRGNPRPDVFPAPPNQHLDLQAAGVPHAVNYYADVFYGTDYDTDYSSYEEGDNDFEIAAEGLDQLETGLALPGPVTPRELTFIRRFETRLQGAAAMDTAAAAMEMAASGNESAADYELARFLPAPVREAIVKKAAMEAYYYLFDKEYVRADGTRFQVRKELRNRLLSDLANLGAQAEKLVIVSHSMGTMVAYDVLRNCPECPQVDTLITLGSPLGVREVQQELIAVGRDSVDFPAVKLRRWINVYDPLDPICGADAKFANDYEAVDGRKVEDVRESNWGKWRHTITHYLAGTRLRQLLREALEV